LIDQVRNLTQAITMLAAYFTELFAPHLPMAGLHEAKRAGIQEETAKELAQQLDQW
jgi:hypothetical protein